MEGGILDAGKDVGRAQFQEELNKWFESRGIIADLRSHLRHLMITALQNTRIGTKPAPEGTSPKSQAVSLVVAEYLHRRRCHYTLSVFASEVPALAGFSCLESGALLRGQGKAGKRVQGGCFQGREVEEILDALGMSSCGEELRRLKERYLEKGNESSLLELFLQAILETSTKLQIRRTLEGERVEGEKRLLSEEWSSRIVDVLLSEKLKPPQITAVERAVFRITECEVKRIAEEEHRFQMQVLAQREKRIQEYLKKHEDEIFLRIMEAEKDLVRRKTVIDEELSERRRHLTRMAVEWNGKHEEMLRLSKSFHDVEKENERLRRRVEELERENESLGAEGADQSRTIDDLRREMSSLAGRLKEVTDSNSVLTERLDALIGRENKEVSADCDDAKQERVKEDAEDIPLLWSRNRTLDAEANSASPQKKERFEVKLKQPSLTVQTHLYPVPWHAGESPENLRGSGDSGARKPAHFDLEEDEEDDSLSRSFSSSSEEVIADVRKKLHDLEEESDRINKTYMEYKLKCLSLDTDSESSRNHSEKRGEALRPAASVRHEDVDAPLVVKETKFSQTDTESPLEKLRKLEEQREGKIGAEGPPRIVAKKQEESLPAVAVRPPTKRQLQNRDFFLQSRQLLQELEKQRVEEFHITTPSNAESSQVSTSSSDELQSFRVKKKKGHKSAEEPVLLTPLRTASFYCNEEPAVQKKPSAESVRTESSNQLPKNDLNCLALLEETRIKSPQERSARKPLRQQILLAESEENGQAENPPKSGAASPPSASSAKVSAGRGSGSEGFW